MASTRTERERYAEYCVEEIEGLEAKRISGESYSTEETEQIIACVDNMEKDTVGLGIAILVGVVVMIFIGAIVRHHSI